MTNTNEDRLLQYQYVHLANKQGLFLDTKRDLQNTKTARRTTSTRHLLSSQRPYHNHQ